MNIKTQLPLSPAPSTASGKWEYLPPLSPKSGGDGHGDGVKIAVINEQHCVGCTKCIQACPVDAIVGAAKYMHSVINHECISCGLCVEPCPVDCIEMQVVEPFVYDKNKTKKRAAARKKRLFESSVTSMNTQNRKLSISDTLARIKANL